MRWEQLENYSGEMETVREKQADILEVKSII